MASIYSTPGRRSTPRHKPLPEGEIHDFCHLIENTPVDKWQIRSDAFERIVKQIPTGTAYTEGDAWYNNPPILRHLAIPISDLLKDARSTVVKRTCASLTKLFNRCQSDARYLFKDLMPTILSVHAQTVQVIRQAVQAMIEESIPEVPCKSIMPFLMERLKIDKSRTVRDACALYLGICLRSWTEEGYLTDEIWLQVARCFLASIRDPSPPVRSYAKANLAYIQSAKPDLFLYLIQDGTKDLKLQRWLESLGRNGGDGNPNEDLSVISKNSYNSDIRIRAVGSIFRSGPSQGNFPRPRQVRSEELNYRSDHDSVSGNSVPTSIAVGPSESAHQSVASRVKPLGNLGPPVRRQVAPAASFSPEPKAPLLPPSLIQVASAAPEWLHLPSDLGQQQHSQTIQTHAEATEEGPFIASMQELKRHASKRRSRSSLLMKERFRTSQSSSQLGSTLEPILVDDHDDDVTVRQIGSTQTELSNEENEVPNPPRTAESYQKSASSATSVASFNAAPEHMAIAIRLLRAHKTHVDSIMETLRIEMDALRDFDKLLEEAGRPNEDEVLDYFESVGLCLEQRTASGSTLRREMDRISRGEPIPE
jgi:archaellum component FlaD/FlaE